MEVVKEGEIQNDGEEELFELVYELIDNDKINQTLKALTSLISTKFFTEEQTIKRVFELFDFSNSGYL